jgi:hypothetical protein
LVICCPLIVISKDIANNQDQKEIFILLLILRFVLQRVFVADIVAKKEEYAFEMFDSLNTTGDPLTAFETFKPKVVEHIGCFNFSIFITQVYSLLS